MIAPQTPASAARPPSAARAWLRRSWRAMARLLGGWTLLDLLFNVRFPAPEPALWYLAPSLDATVLVAIAALYARRGRRAPRAIVLAAAVLVVAVRLFRIGDGGSRRYFNRPLNLRLDLPLFMELVRLLGDTMSRPFMLVLLPVALGLLAGIGALAAWAFRLAERGVVARGARALFGGTVAVFALASLLSPRARVPDGADRRLRGAFADSVVPRFAREALFAARLDGYLAAQTARIDATGRALAARPHGLQRLHGASVFLFFVESYGATVLDQPDQLRRIAPVYAAAEAALAQHGFTVASSLLDSPTYAGRSWLAHTTLTTGVRTTERVTDQIIQRRRPATIASFFHEAGYRTLLVQPANRYRSLPRWLYGFDAVYSSWDFDYRGPTYRWANMPDQYVIDFVHRHEIATARTPLLAAYTLVTSHAPWSDQPRVVDDWSRIGNGAIYRSLGTDRFPITWTNLADGAEAYDHSVAYDLRVIVDYVTRFVDGDALVIVLGDHQPVAEVTRFSSSSAVPIHVMSRSGAFVGAFRARGYTPGMRPAPASAASVRGMETFLPDLLQDFSTATVE
jgi:hypothetical protein